MNSVNTVVISGFLTRDPELRYTPKGTPVCSFAIALNRTFKTDAGEDREETAFVDCEQFGPSGEAFSKHFKKGRPTLIEGRLRMESWEDKTTHKQRTRLKVLCERWHFMQPKQPTTETTAAPPSDAVGG
jgi:single-strand DNA-binding protein